MASRRYLYDVLRTSATFMDSELSERSKRTAKHYRSRTVNSKSFVGKVLLRIKWKFEVN